MERHQVGSSGNRTLPPFASCTFSRGIGRSVPPVLVTSMVASAFCPTIGGAAGWLIWKVTIPAATCVTVQPLQVEGGVQGVTADVEYLGSDPVRRPFDQADSRVRGKPDAVDGQGGGAEVASGRIH